MNKEMFKKWLNENEEAEHKYLEIDKEVFKVEFFFVGNLLDDNTFDDSQIHEVCKLYWISEISVTDGELDNFKYESPEYFVRWNKAKTNLDSMIRGHSQNHIGEMGESKTSALQYLYSKFEWIKK